MCWAWSDAMATATAQAALPKRVEPPVARHPLPRRIPARRAIPAQPVRVAARVRQAPAEQGRQVAQEPAVGKTEPLVSGPVRSKPRSVHIARMDRARAMCALVRKPARDILSFK